MRFYDQQAWKDVRKYVLKRDNYICQPCYKNQRLVGADTVHHIIKVDDAPLLALEPDNLQSLCRECHRLAHPRRRKAKPKELPKRNARIIKG